MQFRLEGCRSLKDKRSVLQSVVARVRREFQVAVAETGDQDLWGNATIGVACVSNDARHAESVLDRVLAAFEACADLSVSSASKSVERY